MVFDASELQFTGIDDRNIITINQFEQYLADLLSDSEPIRDIFISVDRDQVFSDVYFFTDSLMIEVPDFVTYYDGKMHVKKMNFTIHPLKNNITFLNQIISEPTASSPRTVQVKFGLKSGPSFSFTETKENARKLEIISKAYLVHNLSHE
jgi:hypothetical protein